MEFHHSLLFIVTFFLAVATPGPATTAVVGHCLSKGVHGLFALIFGLLCGDFFWLALALLGLSALAQTFTTAFLIFKLLGAAYLLFLAFKLWTAKVNVDIVAPSSRIKIGSLFGAGLLINISNPKAGVFYMALLPSIIDLERISALESLQLMGLISLILISVFGCYGYLAIRARELVTNEKSLRILNRTTSLAFVVAAVAVATR